MIDVMQKTHQMMVNAALIKRLILSFDISEHQRELAVQLHQYGLISDDEGKSVTSCS